MGLAKTILIFLLRVCNLFRFLMPIKKDKITFISLTSDHLESDFKAIEERLDKERYDVHYNLIVFKNGFVDDFKYMLNCIKQLYEINTSKLIIINDNNFVIAKFKREGTTILQTWHACGAIKKFGNQIKRQYPIQNYDVILSNSNYWEKAYSEAFGGTKENILVSGMPRVDVLCKEENKTAFIKQFEKSHPDLQEKYKVLYAPTFRGNIIKGLRSDEIDLNKLLEILPSNYVILYKMHPLIKEVSLGENKRLINVNDEDLYSLLCGCDCLISDYSSILFDYSLLHKKMIAYAKDYEDYEKTIGFNIDYVEEMPCPIASDESELITQLLDPTFDETRYLHFQQTFMPFTDGQNTTRVLQKIHEIMK